LENRTLTNFIETLLQRRIVELSSNAVQDGAGMKPPSRHEG
jgi:hypothetical protein